MIKIFYESDVDFWVTENGEHDATALAYEHCQKELQEMCKAMNAFDKAFKKLQQTFPDANMYSGSDGGLDLLLGASHDDATYLQQAQQQRVVHIKKMAWDALSFRWWLVINHTILCIPINI